jgi:Immune inhibitor A-like, MAM domain
MTMGMRCKAMGVPFIVCLLLAFLATPALSEGLPSWSEDFEGNWQDCWHVDAGTWEVGSPASGPGSAHSGINSAATTLAGVYSNYADSRLVRHCPFVVSATAPDPGLTFWHWFDFYPNDDDYGQVQIRVVGDSGWTTLAECRNSGGGVWSRTFVPLADYAGQTVEIAFYFHSDNAFQKEGWYIDDVSYEEGPRVLTSPQDWESGFEDWHADFGTWEVGAPASGPGSAHGGANCAATRLDGIYSNNAESRLISPPFAICPASANPVLRFWHWFDFYPNDEDYGQVQIRVVGDADWTPLAEYRNSGGAVWSPTYFALADYAGQTVEIAFYFHSDNAFQKDGWYIDDIVLEGYFSEFMYDYEPDGDIDGIDLHVFATSFDLEELARFAMNFGRSACR